MSAMPRSIRFVSGSLQMARASSATIATPVALQTP